MPTSHYGFRSFEKYHGTSWISLSSDGSEASELARKQPVESVCTKEDWLPDAVSEGLSILQQASPIVTPHLKPLGPRYLQASVAERKAAVAVQGHEQPWSLGLGQPAPKAPLRCKRNIKSMPDGQYEGWARRQAVLLALEEKGIARNRANPQGFAAAWQTSGTV
jgi:hypothetical protein